MNAPAKIIAEAEHDLASEARQIIADVDKVPAPLHAYSGAFTLGQWREAAERALDCDHFDELAEMLAADEMAA